MVLWVIVASQTTTTTTTITTTTYVWDNKRVIKTHTSLLIYIKVPNNHISMFKTIWNTPKIMPHEGVSNEHFGAFINGEQNDENSYLTHAPCTCKLWSIVWL